MEWGCFHYTFCIRTRDSPELTMGKMQELHNRHGYKSGAISAAEVCSADMQASFGWFRKHTALDIKNASFFEIGAGSGNFYSFLKPLDPGAYQGTEISEHQIAQFQKLFPGEALVKKDALAALREKKGKTDCVAAFDVLEHLEEDYLTELFSFVAERLERGGEFWIKVPCAESMISLYVRYSDLTHKRLFTLKNFMTLAEMHQMTMIAAHGKIVKISRPKDVVRYLYNGLWYAINRIAFSFEIGTKKELGVFSNDLLVLLRKK